MWKEFHIGTQIQNDSSKYVCIHMFAKFWLTKIPSWCSICMRVTRWFIMNHTPLLTLKDSIQTYSQLIPVIRNHKKWLFFSLFFFLSIFVLIIISLFERFFYKILSIFLCTDQIEQILQNNSVEFLVLQDPIWFVLEKIYKILWKKRSNKLNRYLYNNIEYSVGCRYNNNLSIAMRIEMVQLFM